MLESRKDYTYLTQNAIRRVQIDGMPYPVRRQKLVIRGEDEAYLREAFAERAYIQNQPLTETTKEFVITSVILRITRSILRADWIYSLIKSLIEYSGGDTIVGGRTWMDADKVLDSESWMPQGVVAAVTGILKTDKPSGVEEAVAAAKARIDNANAKMSVDAKTAFDALVEELNNLYDARDAAVDSAESGRDSVVVLLREELDADLAKMAEDHAKRLATLKEQYESKKADPDEDQRKAWSEYRNAVLEENNGYAESVEQAKAEELRGEQDAENECRKTVRESEETLYYSSKSSVAEYRKRRADIVEERDAEVEDATAERNATATEIEVLHTYSGYLTVGPGGVGGEWKTFSDSVRRMEAAREGMEITRLCLGKYLKKTPLLIGKPDKEEGQLEEDVYTVPDETFAAHAPSSDATMRAFADIERLRCCALSSQTVYRDAYISMSLSGTQYHDMAELDGYNNVFENKAVDNAGDWSISYSSKSFSVFFGRRGELDIVKDVYATVMIARSEGAGYFEDNEEKENRTVGYIRVKLENMGIEAEDDLAEIDAIRDALAKALEDAAKTRDEAYAAADKEYYSAIEENAKERDKAYKDAEEARDEQYRDNARRYVDAMSAEERTANTRIAGIEDDDEGNKYERIETVMSEFAAKDDEMKAARIAADAEAEAKMLQAREYADEKKASADNDAEASRDVAKAAADNEYDDATDNLAEDSEDAIEEIKERPEKRREAINESYSQEIQTAAAKRDAKVDEAREEFYNALQDVKVDGRPITSDPEWLSGDPPPGHGGFPYVWPSQEAIEHMDSKADYDAFIAAHNTANAKYNAAWAEYYAAEQEANRRRWERRAAVEDIREDARCRWSFTPTAIDSEALSPSSGTYWFHYSDLYMAGVVHLDVVYEPKSATGADFSAYYAELEDKGGSHL